MKKINKIFLAVATVIVVGVVLLILGLFVNEKKGGKEYVASSNDARILLTILNRNGYNFPDGGEPGCREIFNNAEPNSKHLYDNPGLGISFEVPFNARWGNNKYRLNPYDEGKTVFSGYQIEYGPMGIFDGCRWQREFTVSLEEKKTAANLVAELKKQETFPGMFSVGPVAVKIDGLDVVKYETNGMCVYPTMVVIGEKYNYKFSSDCGSGSDDFESLEKVIKTVRLRK